MITRYLFAILLTLSVSLGLAAQVTIEQCVNLAQENYPLIKKYNLLNSLNEINLSDINKSWLPQINVYAQGNVQNATPSFPDRLSGMLKQMGTDISGLNEWQYKIGADLNQTIWDGGSSKARREIERTQHAEKQAALDVQLYAVKERVESLFFGILLIDEQAKQIRASIDLLQDNLQKLRSMLKNGIAMQCDADMVEAQYLATSQQLIQARSMAESYRRLLEIYIGESLAGRELITPDAVIPGDLVPNRPEQKLFNAQLLANDALRNNITSSIMPQIGLFAQAYYGYPGYDYFENMMNRNPSFNILAGVKISWNIGAFYTKKNSNQKLKLAAGEISADRETFLFNTSLETQSQVDNINELKAVIKEDGRIVELRANVRRAAESQLDNGTIDATALLTKITDEKQARLNAAYHEIQLLQSIYKLKHTVNK